MSNSRTVPPGSTGGAVIIRSIERSALFALCALVLPLFLSACGPAEPSGASNIRPSSAQISPTTGEPIAGITAPPAPPGSSDRPLSPGQSGTPYMPNGLPAFQPARGVNADMLFAEKISDTDERFRRLENAVMDLRREHDAVMPAIVRLAAVESDMQELVGQLQTLVNGGPAPDMNIESSPVEGVTSDALPERPFPTAPEDMPESVATDVNGNALPTDGSQPQPEPAKAAPVETKESLKIADSPPPEPVKPLTQAPPPPAPVTPPPAQVAQAPPQPLKVEPKQLITPPPPAVTPAPTPPAAVVTPVPASPGKIAVQSIRVGLQDNGNVRLVLDLSAAAKYSFDLDNAEHLLLIEIPQAQWSAAPKGKFAENSLLTSWTTEPMEGGTGTRLILELSNDVEVVSEQTLADPPRIVLDFRKSP